MQKIDIIFVVAHSLLILAGICVYINLFPQLNLVSHTIINFLLLANIYILIDVIKSIIKRNKNDNFKY